MATPEQWAQVEEWGNLGSTRDACVLELRDRIEALEQNHFVDVTEMVDDDDHPSLTAQERNPSLK